MSMIDTVSSWLGLSHGQPVTNGVCKSHVCKEAHRVTDRLIRTRLKLSRKRRRYKQLLNQATAKGSAAQIERAARKLHQVEEQVRLLGMCGLRASATPALDDRGRRLDLVVSSFQLLDSFRYCTQTSDEGLHFLIGFDTNSRSIVSGMRTFPYASRSPGHATGDQRATHQITHETHEGGHRVLAIVHSHPGNGPDANHPSSRDYAGQVNIEPWSRLAGAIWSRDGYLRFWSVELPFSVRIMGNHFEQMEDQLWRLL